MRGRGPIFLVDCTRCRTKLRWERLFSGAVFKQSCPTCGVTQLLNRAAVALAPEMMLAGFDWDRPDAPALFHWDVRESAWVLVNRRQS